MKNAVAVIPLILGLFSIGCSSPEPADSRVVVTIRMQNSLPRQLDDVQARVFLPVAFGNLLQARHGDIELPDEPGLRLSSDVNENVVLYVHAPEWAVGETRSLKIAIPFDRETNDVKNELPAAARELCAANASESESADSGSIAEPETANGESEGPESPGTGDAAAACAGTSPQSLNAMLALAEGTAPPVRAVIGWSWGEDARPDAARLTGWLEAKAGDAWLPLQMPADENRLALRRFGPGELLAEQPLAAQVAASWGLDVDIRLEAVR